MKEALKPFANLLENPEDCIVNENGMIQLYIHPNDVKRAKDALKEPSRFLLVAYKPQSADYSRGCLMASYHADHVVHNQLAHYQLINLWAGYLLKNLNLDYNEAGYDFFIFKDGVQVWKEQNATWDGAERYDYNSDAYHEHLTEFDRQEAEDTEEIHGIHNQAKTLAENNHRLNKEAEQARKVLEQQEANIKAKEKCRKEFEKLQKEFGNEEAV